MKKILERIVASESAPGHYDLWVDTNNESPELKINFGYDKNSGWKTIGGSGGGPGSGDSSSSAPAVINVPGVFSGVRFVPTLNVEPGKQEDASAQAALWNEVADAFKNGATVNLVSDGDYYRVISLENVTSNDITMQFLAVLSMNSMLNGEQGGLCGWINPGTMPSSSGGTVD